MRLPSTVPAPRSVLLVLLPVAMAAALLALAPRPAAAESILLNPPSGWNGIAISGSVTAGWKQSGGAAIATSSPSTSFLLAGPSFPPLTPGQVLTGPTASATILPTSGDAKDKAHVSLSYSVTVGAAGPGSSDKFNFSILGETSAQNATYDFGGGIGVQNADAFIIADFTIMSFAPIPAGTFASIGLPALPVLTAPAPNVETMTTTANVGPYGAWTTTIVMAPGYGGSILPLTLGPSVSDAFEYRMTYMLTTPYGTDPSVSLSFEGSMERASVPEIGLLQAPVALLAGALGLLEWRSRRRRAPWQRDASTSAGAYG